MNVCSRDHMLLGRQVCLSMVTPGTIGDLTSANEHGGRCARIIARMDAPGTISPMMQLGLAPIAGTRMAWQGLAMIEGRCALLWRSGMAGTQFSRNDSLA